MRRLLQDLELARRLLLVALARLLLLVALALAARRAVVGEAHVAFASGDSFCAFQSTMSTHRALDISSLRGYLSLSPSPRKSHTC